MKHFYKTKFGRIYHSDSLEYMPLLQDGEVNLIMTSPPFGLVRKKDYGNADAHDYLDWFRPFAEHFRRVLKEDGSLVIDIGGACLHGHPVRSIYQYDLLCRMAKELNLLLAA